MTVTERIDAEQAQELQNQAITAGYLLMWTVLHGTKEYGDLWVARPWAVGDDTKPETPLPVILIANQLSELRDILPMGLSRLSRNPEDDPVITEVWL